MESDRVNTTSDGAGDGLQRIRPLHGRTSGPTRRSTKGQWTAEEDEILCKAVQRFKGKNWKKIAECFKDRTDVQCLHRWQKVLNPELVKGPWSKKEDEIIVEMVNKYGPKKWSTIAQHLPGRIGKQCRERWHNHLNPNINKEAWTQEEELTLIRAHQIYGNKWAELTKFLSGRTDNAIKNHWNSSVKKKLDSYLASGLLAQFQGLPHVGYPNQSMPSSSSAVQSSGDDSVPKDGTEAEEISECSQSSTIVVQSQSTSGLPNAEVSAREECQLTEDSCNEKDPSFSPASCSENYQTAFQEVALPTPDVPCELGDSSNFLESNHSQDWESYAGKAWQNNANDLSNISALELGQESSELLMHCVRGNVNHEVIHFPFQTSMGSDAFPPMENTVLGSDNAQQMMISEVGCCGVVHSEGETDGCFYSGDFAEGPDIVCSNGSADSLLYLQSSYQIANPPMSDLLGTSCSQPVAVPSQFPHDNDPLLFGSEPARFSALLHGNQEEELSKGPNDDFICTNDTVNTVCDNSKNYRGLQDETDWAKDSLKLVPANALCSGPSNNIQDCSSINENPILPTEQDGAGALFYEPPRFPCLDIPFFSCDLIQSGNGMQQEYSPLGIRQLMISSPNCFTPFRLWDSPLRDDSPDVVLKSAAKTFMCTPSILKKRNRDLVSPVSEKQIEKKLESDKKHESCSNLARDFSRLDVLMYENENQKTYLWSPSSNQKEKSRNYTCNKENLNNPPREERRERTMNNNTSEKDSSRDFLGNTKQEIASIDTETNNEIDAVSQNVQQVLGVLVEHNLNEQLFSPDHSETRSDGALWPDNRTPGNQCIRWLETKTNQIALSESSLMVTSPFDSKWKKQIAAKSEQSGPANQLEITAGCSGSDAGFEHLSIFGETPFKRSIESPSAWKSPWFVNSFLSGPRVDADMTAEDITYFMSPADRSYDAIGLMKQLSEHTSAAFADAQEVLGEETPDTILKERCSRIQKTDQDSCVQKGQQDNHSPLASNFLTERRVLDFSECGTPGKDKESGKLSAALSFSSPSSYLLKGCR